MNFSHSIRLLLLFVLFNASASAQQLTTVISYEPAMDNPADRYIFYQPDQSVFISDFKGRPDAASDAVAITNSGFMFKMGYRSAAGKATLNIKVFCSFDREKSWMKENGKTDYILQHEQLHFDISYLSSQLFLKKLKATNFTASHFKEQLREVYDDAVNNLELLQNQYDSETRNGIEKIKQASWNKKVKQQLHSITKL